MHLRTKLILLVALTWLLSTSVMYLLLSSNENKYVKEEVANRARSITKIVALLPELQNWIIDPDKHEQVQEMTEALRKETNVDFIVVFNNDGIRLSHPNVKNIGKHIEGNDELNALNGEEYISVAKGSLGESIRAFSPIYKDGKQIGAVVTGVSMNAVEAAIQRRNMQMLGGGMLVLCIGIVLTIVVSRKIKNSLLDMEPQELARITVERNAVIQSVHEGVIVIDKNGYLQIVNEEAKRIFAKGGITGNLVGRLAADVIPHTRMMDIVQSGQVELNQEQKINTVVILTNRVPLIVEGEIVGAIATFRDFKEIWELSEELTGVKNYIEALRVRAHEYRNTLHVINGLVANREYNKLREYIQSLALTDATEFEEISRQVKDPVILSFLQSKRSRSRELNTELIFDSNMKIPNIKKLEFRNAIITILGNLIDNAMEAVQLSEKKQVKVNVYQSDGWYIEVIDTGCGIQDDVKKILQKGYSTKGKNRGLGLYLIAKIVYRFNGKLGIQPNHPQGTIFSIYLHPE
ncbi:hypothetical protein CJ260_06040 [Megasphaera sp. ASD88]|uniref:ATP-binding protein n=1 Tax=Megasphaera sp. ASD88 TaxID=2027407 RepID=UPI000BAB5575|nr:ATP-binding protein [Megasphaera sp. ASD88]PAV39003.1 hypothetical protein CJ260_06040 [Megasphaera sp. ASD88]